MDSIVREQILCVRETGLTNMFSIPGVKSVADRMGFAELAEYVEQHQKEYCNFILYGD